jgi:DnaJ-class molecular chaperone
VDPTYYDILGVPEQADHATLQKAYRRKAQKLHPDRNPGNAKAAENFVQVQKAWQVLGNVASRQDYDLVLRQTYKAQEAAFVQETAPASGVSEGVFGSVKNWFRRPRTEWDPHGPGGYHIHIRLPVSRTEAWEGTWRTIDTRVASTCPLCGGKNPRCPACGGTGQVFENRRFRVQVPRGSLPGQQLRLFEQGHSGPFTTGPGDVLIRLDFDLPYPWKFEGHDLVTPYLLTADEAEMGGRLEFRGIQDNRGHFTVPAFLEHGQRVRIRGQGWMKPDGSRGDAWLVVRIRDRVANPG